jgi:uncharacterized protein
MDPGGRRGYLADMSTSAAGTADRGLDAGAWTEVEASLGERPYAHLQAALSGSECAALAALYDDESRFRSRVVMERHRFGAGEYKYFSDPLPPAVRLLREALYPPLAGIANRWMERLGSDDRFPETLDAFRRRCAEQGQEQPTPLLLRYEAGGYNCLHQDVYGPVAFPLQAVVVLSRPGIDFTGGEFVLVEQRPRAQSVATVVTPAQGDLVVFPNRFRPVAGARGHSRTAVRHGLSRLHSGRRYALGLIFHDAR